MTNSTEHTPPAKAFDVPGSLVTWDVRAPLFMAGQSVLTALLICSTSKSSVLRPACLPILLGFMYASWQVAAKFTGQGVLYSFWWVGPYANVFHCMNNLCLHPLDDGDIRREMDLWATKSKPATPIKQPSLLRRVWFAVSMCFSFRGIGTTHVISYVPPFPGGVVPSRAKFLVRQCLVILLQYMIMDMLASSPPPPDVVDGWAEGKEWLWISALNPHPVTSKDLINRFVGCVMNWYLLGRAMNDIWYRVFSVIFVGLGVSQPRQWPPCYGSYSDTATLRGYFGKFWHQTLRWPFQGISKFVTRRLLHMRRGPLERHSNMTIVFFLSASLHSILDVAFGSHWRPIGSFMCFAVLLPLGIIIEDAVQSLWVRMAGQGASWFGRVVGHIWVAVYLTAVTPIFNYQIQRIEEDPTYLVPWSIIRRSK